MDIESMTIDEIYEHLQWIANRAHYRNACNIPDISGDGVYELQLLAELSKREAGI